MLVDMINKMEVREDDEEFQNPVDIVFERLKKKDPDHFAVRQYAKFKLAAGVISYKRHLENLMVRQMGAYLYLRRCIQWLSQGYPQQSRLCMSA